MPISREEIAAAMAAFTKDGRTIKTAAIEETDSPIKWERVNSKGQNLRIGQVHARVLKAEFQWVTRHKKPQENWLVTVSIADMPEPLVLFSNGAYKPGDLKRGCTYDFKLRDNIDRRAALGHRHFEICEVPTFVEGYNGWKPGDKNDPQP